MAVHEIENQVIKEFDRFISIFSINLEFFLLLLLIWTFLDIAVSK